MNLAAAEATKTVFLYNPSDAVTVTVTQTPTVSPQTWTIGTPWTTATGSLFTRTNFYPTPSVVVFHQYPPQPQPYQQRPCYCHRDKRAGAIAASFFGGMGAGMVLLVLGLIIWRWRRRGRVQLTEGSMDYEYEPRGRASSKTPLLADVEGAEASNNKKQTTTAVSRIFN